MTIFKNNDIERAIALVIDSFFVNFFFNLIFKHGLLSGLIDINYNFLLLTFLCYLILFDFINNGQTLGKMLLGLNTKKDTNINERILRSFLKLVSIYITPITIIIYLIKKRILHDILLNSKEVIRN